MNNNNISFVGDVSLEKESPIFNGLYFITCDGRLFSARSSKFLSSNTDRYGYAYYVISINGKRYTLKAHRLVADAYIPNPDNKPTVNHKNGIRNDNRVENLEWATYLEQQADPLTTANRNVVVARTDYHKIGAVRNFGRKKTAVYRDGKLLGVYPTLKKASEKYCVSMGKASMCANGKVRQAGGVQFCYI